MQPNHVTKMELGQFVSALKAHRLLHSGNIEVEFMFESFREIFKEAMQIFKHAIPMARNNGQPDGKEWWEGFPFFFQALCPIFSFDDASPNPVSSFRRSLRMMRPSIASLRSWAICSQLSTTTSTLR